jgi:hypothetical protein
MRRALLVFMLMGSILVACSVTQPSLPKPTTIPTPTYSACEPPTIEPGLLPDRLPTASFQWDVEIVQNGRVFGEKDGELQLSCIWQFRWTHTKHSLHLNLRGFAKPRRFIDSPHFAERIPTHFASRSGLCGIYSGHL